MWTHANSHSNTINKFYDLHNLCLVTVQQFKTFLHLLLSQADSHNLSFHFRPNTKWGRIMRDVSGVHQFLEKFSSHLNILGAIRVTWSKFYLQILGASVKNVLIHATRYLELCIPNVYGPLPLWFSVNSLP